MSETARETRALIGITPLPSRHITMMDTTHSKLRPALKETQMALLNQPAPNFTLINSQKEEVTLSDLSGSKVVLAFYPAAFSGICDQEMCIFEDRLKQLNNAQAQVVGVSPDSPFANAKFAEVNGITFPLLSDLHLEVTRQYGVEFQNFAFIEGYTACNRAVFVIGEDGTVIYEWIAEHPGIQPDYDEVMATL